jgi:hypothetical protein
MSLAQADSTAAARALARVVAAFPAQPLPASVPILAQREWVDKDGQVRGYSDPDDEKIERFFGRVPWSSIEPLRLLRWPPAGEASALLSVEATAHFLPAYLRAFLAVPLDPVTFAVMEDVVSLLTRREPDAARRVSSPANDVQYASQQAASVDFFEALTNALTDAQKAAVAEFLQVMAPLFDDPDLDNPVRTALERFWGAYSPS